MADAWRPFVLVLIALAHCFPGRPGRWARRTTARRRAVAAYMGPHPSLRDRD